MPGPAGLEAILDEARRRGFLGPGPVGRHIAGALSLVEALAPHPGRAVDLGSGGGVPGLPLALALPGTEWILLEGSTTRAAFLEWAVRELGIEGRVRAVCQRAEDAGRSPLRGCADAVVARGFGPPAVTAECAAPLLRRGGRLVVCEPPAEDPDRWPADGLATLGLEPGIFRASTAAHRVLRQVADCPDRFPRRVGIPSKRPLF